MELLWKTTNGVSMVLKEITIGLNGIPFISTIVVGVKDTLSEELVDISRN